jgi:hypothetical protein
LVLDFRQQRTKVIARGLQSFFDGPQFLSLSGERINNPLLLGDPLNSIAKTTRQGFGALPHHQVTLHGLE